MESYRFSLQWSSETAEKAQAGELLESLGNRKSEFVVLAVSEYIEAHPESLLSGQKPRIVVRPSLTRDQIEAIVVSILEKRMENPPAIQRKSGEIDVKPADTWLDIEDMIKNLELFE